MPLNSHRLNSDFQLTYFLANNCATPDGAWALLYGQKLDMENKIASADLFSLKIQAKESKVKEAKEESSEYFDALVELKQIKIDADLHEKNFIGAKNELETINKLMAKLEPQCKYSNLEIHSRLAASQKDEWAGELMKRGENMLLSNIIGIPYDHIETMRSHPDFNSKILPHLLSVGKSIAQLSHTTDPKLIENAFTSQIPSLQLTNSFGENK